MRLRVLGSGSSGNATLVESGSVRILVDAGLGPCELADRLASAGVDPASLALVLLSHEHQDHARGAASFSKKWGVRLCGSRGTYAAAGLGAEDIAGYDVLEPGTSRAVGSLSVRGVPVPHDAAGPLGFVIEGDGASLAHATDFGHVSRAVAEGFRECDVVLIESNYDPVMLRDGPYPWSVKERILGSRGHLSNDDVARFLYRDLGEACRMVVLAHVSQSNNHPELVRMTAESALRRRGRTEVGVELAAADGTGWMEVRPADASSPRPRQLRLW
jgi:phosphoribosyl 1,2-cyclic phosphodiesterase